MRPEEDAIPQSPGYCPHPEELAKQASRRIEATHGLAAILRDAAKTPLLRMRSKIYSQPLGMRSEINFNSWTAPVGYRLPDGQISSPSAQLRIMACLVLLAKIFRLTRRANHFY
jgi:hypothetical protein